MANSIRRSSGVANNRNFATDCTHLPHWGLSRHKEWPCGVNVYDDILRVDSSPDENKGAPRPTILKPPPSRQDAPLIERRADPRLPSTDRYGDCRRPGIHPVPRCGNSIASADPLFDFLPCSSDGHATTAPDTLLPRLSGGDGVPEEVFTGEIQVRRRYLCLHAE